MIGMTLPTRRLGRTGLDVSVLALGTAALGADYGLGPAGRTDARPPEAEARAVLERALAAGITLFDTAPAYGEAERLVGDVVGDAAGICVATKVTLPPAAEVHRYSIADELAFSVEASVRRLRRRRLDVVQVHNATAEAARDPAVLDALATLQTRGLCRFLGASVYGTVAAEAILDAACFDVVQVAYNLLDQRMANTVLPRAHAVGVSVLVRSALLKGVLSRRAAWLPRELHPLGEAAVRARDALHVTWDSLPAVAMRFCLSHPAVGAVLIGASHRDELELALRAASAGPLTPDEQSIARTVALDDPALVDPRLWPSS